ncbi:MAG: hypothetical protein AAGD14_03660 [Planctomycetota bacterium]
MRISRPLLALGLGLVIGLGFLWTQSAQAQQQDRRRGWTVFQNGKTKVYPHADRWTANPTPSGMTFRNGSTGENVLYYGTFRVEERTRDLR